MEQNKNYYTKEQIKKLKDLGVEYYFNTVVDCQYKRGTTKEQDQTVLDIYTTTTGDNTPRNLGCKSCVYSLYLAAGKLYRESIKYHQQEQMRIAREAKKNKEQKTDKENGTEKGKDK